MEGEGQAARASWEEAEMADGDLGWGQQREAARYGYGGGVTEKRRHTWILTLASLCDLE